MDNPQLLDLQKRIDMLRGEPSSELDIKNATTEARNCRLRLTKKRLAQY